MIANRVIFGETLCALGHEDQKIVVVDSDAASCMNYKPFIQAFPERFFQCGIAEQNMMSVAIGLSTCGLIAFTGSFAVFSSMRALDQLRNGACYNHFNVKVAGTHAGLDTGQDGATHQATEDIAIMRSIPDIKVLVPSTPNMTQQLTRLAAYTDGPVYLRFGRSPSEELYNADEVFDFGNSKELVSGNDATIIACGSMVSKAVEAASVLKKHGIHARVIDMYSIKPIDINAILRAAKETKGIVTVEDHSVIGGLGGAVCETVADFWPARVIRLGVKDVFGRSGVVEDLYQLYGLTVENIIKAVQTFSCTDHQ